MKSAYRDLSRKHHPDRGGDAAMFQKIAKAYEALSDPDARANWEKYGNPDGKQTLEVAIGLPSFMVDARGQYVVLAAYLAVLVVAVPLLMRRFWKKTAADMGAAGLHPASTQWFQMMINPSVTARMVPEIYAGCKEFEAAVALTETDAQELQSVAGALLDERNPRMVRLRIERSVIPREAIARNSALLHAHMSRKDLLSPALQAAVPALLAKLEPAVLFNVAVCQVWTAQQQNARETAREAKRPVPNAVSFMDVAEAWCVFAAQATQALYGKDSSLLQVFTEADAERVRHSPRMRGTGLGALLRLPAEDQSAVLDDVGLAADARAEYARVLRDLPVLELAVTYEVKDEDFIAVGDLITATVTVRHANLLAAGAKEDARVPPVYAPRYPSVRDEMWAMWVTDEAQRLVCPIQSPWVATRAVETFSFGFPAPKAGKKTFTLHLRSTCYLDLDVDVSAP